MIRPKKSFGQHFLRDEGISSRIASSLLNAEGCKNLLEVGPGMGMLTKYLLKFNQFSLKVVEADQDMVDFLKKEFHKLEGRIVFEDFLKTDLLSLFPGEQFSVIGNFPYNISSQIVIKVLDHKEFIPEMAGMFQKEVAERICAGPGSKEYGGLSVLTQAFYKTEYLFSVKPGSFNPPPKVQSGVLRLIRRTGHELGCDEKSFKQVVKASFATRRKMLRNNLNGLLPKELLQADPFFQKRAEELGVEDFVRIANMRTGKSEE